MIVVYTVSHMMESDKWRRLTAELYQILSSNDSARINFAYKLHSHLESLLPETVWQKAVKSSDPADVHSMIAALGNLIKRTPAKFYEILKVMEKEEALRHIVHDFGETELEPGKYMYI